MTNKPIFIFTCIIIMCCSVQAGVNRINPENSSLPAVIAIIDTTPRDEKLTKAISLMTTRFSKAPNITLVEREEINIVLNELDLSVSGFVSREHILQIGRLLRADGLVFVSLSDDEKILRVRLVDTRYGFRFLDTMIEWNEKNIEGITKEISSHVLKVMPKLIIPPEKEVLVGILSIRNIDPSSTLNWLELSLPGLISSRLSSEPTIIVLEREDLNLVLEEKLFTQGPESNFLGSMVLLDGDIRQVSAKKEDSYRFILSLQIRQANGEAKKRVELEGDIEKLVLLAEESTKWIVREVTKTTVQGTWDTKAEAEEFFKEAKVLMAHEDWLAARPLLETARALEPEDNETIKCLLRQMQKASHEVSPFERARMFRRYIELVDFQFCCRIEKLESNLAALLFYELNPVWEYLNSISSVQTEEVRIFNRQTRRHCDDLSVRVHNFSKIPEESPVYRSWMVQPIGWIGAVSENPEDAMKRIKEELIPWMLQRPVEDRSSELSRIQILDGWFVSYNGLHIMNAGHLEKQKVCELWIGFLEELTKMDDPIIRLFAELGLAKAFYEMSGWKKDDVQVSFHCDKALDILNKDLNYPNVPLIPEAWGVLERTIRYILSFTSKEGWFTKAEVLPPEFETCENLKISILCDLKEYLTEFDLKLLDIDKRLFSWWTNAVMEKDTIWISSVNHYIREIWLIGINLEENNLHAFWRMPLPSNANFTAHGIMNKPVVNKDVIYLGIHGAGIVKFPRTAKTGMGRLENVEIITEKDGLLSKDITSVARIKNKLYMGISSLNETESGFGVYDLEKRKWKTIASSRSKDKTCPLNGERPFKIVSLTPTSDGKKLFFICHPRLPEVPEVVIPGLWAPEIGGLWRMDIESENLEQIWCGGFDELISEEEKWWVGGGGSFIISFDPVSETGEITVCYNKDWYYSACNEIRCGTEKHKPPSKENAYIIPETLGGRITLLCDGLYKNAFWGLTNEGKLFSITINQSQPKLEEYPISTLDGDRITWLCPTPYGVVVAGGGKIGLIEDEQEM